jgi:hypothetical protein
MRADARESVMFIVVLIGFGFTAGLLCELLWHYFKTKHNQLNDAASALKNHFDIVDGIVDSEAVDLRAKQIMVRISRIVCDPDAAATISTSIREKKAITLDPLRERALNYLFEEIRRLRTVQSDLATSFTNAIELAFAAMIIRWPFSQVALSALAVQDAESSGGASFREKVRHMLSAMPIEYFEGPGRDKSEIEGIERQKWAAMM